MSSKVHLTWPSPCEGVLKLTEVKLKEKPDYYDRVEDIDYESALHEKNTEFSKALEEFPLRFSFEDGKIMEICPSLEEKTWTLNLKRGLLSLLHNSMERLDVDQPTMETDIHGDCSTEYKYQGAHGTSLVIEKTKDLKLCENRAKVESAIQMEPYTFRKVLLLLSTVYPLCCPLSPGSTPLVTPQGLNLFCFRIMRCFRWLIRSWSVLCPLTTIFIIKWNVGKIICSNLFPKKILVH